jgi:hypothetical protein
MISLLKWLRTALAGFTQLRIAPQGFGQAKSKKQKTAGVAGGFWKVGTFSLGTFRTLLRRRRLRTKNSQKSKRNPKTWLAI